MSPVPTPPTPPLEVIIRELSYSSDDKCFVVHVEGISEDTQRHVTTHVRSPFVSEEDAADLNWYAEAADREPFSVSARLHATEQLIQSYGTSLFKMVFSSPLTTLPNDRFVAIRVVGTSRFCSLHWELLRDPINGPVALDPNRCLVRDICEPSPRDRTPHPITSYPTLNVLFLTARQRIDEKDIPLRIESLAVMDSVRNHDLPLRFDLVRPGTIPALWDKLEQVKPGFYHILHLDCHGAGGDHAFNPFCDSESNRLLLETERADFTTVSAQDIKHIVDNFKIPIVVTSACRSGMSNPGRPSFAYELFSKSNVQCVLAMALSVLVDTTARFVREFYRAILDPSELNSVRSATRRARLEMHKNPHRMGVMGSIERQDWWIPQLFERKVPDLSETGLFIRCSWEDAALHAESPEDKSLVWEDSELNVKRKNLLINEPVDEKTFLGRNEDLRLLECKVFSHDRADNIILLYGMVGCGKTAFVTYVSWWWSVTGLVRDKFVFRMHERSFNLNQMIWHIYRQLFNVSGYDPTNLCEAQIEEDRRRVTDHLKKHCYVIVIDGAERLCTREETCRSAEEGFESLPAQYESEFESDSEDGRCRSKASPRSRDREQIAEWLAELQGGHTIVLVGFRGSSESDLMKYIKNRSNKLDLATIVGKYPSRLIGNLSAKWSEALVRQILDENGDSSDPRYTPLYTYPMLDLYAGNPLVIKLMVGSFKAGDLANAPHPEDLFERLQKHLTNPSMSVMTSLEYSFNLLSPSQREALLFLAPFKGSVTAQGLKHYADALEQDTESVINFDRAAWDSAIEMAVRWGLLTHHERMTPQQSQPAWRIHAYLSLLLMRKLCHKRACASRGTLNELEHSRGYAVLEHADKEKVLRPMLKPMHVAYWKWALQLYDFLRDSDKVVHDFGRVMTEIEFWNLKRVLRYALEEKQAFYGVLLPMYWYLAAKNDITQRFALCRRIVEKVGTFDSFSKIPSSNEVYRKDVPRAYHIYGMLLGHNRLHKLSEAEEWFRRTNAIWRECGNKSELAVTEHELGWVAMNRREYAKARKHYTKALDLSDRLGRSRTLHNMGLLAAQQEDFETARKYHEGARLLYEEQKDVRAVASAYHHMAIVSAKLHRFERAEQYAKKALVTRKQREETEQTANVYQLRGNIAQRRAREEGVTTSEALRYLDFAKRKYAKAMVAYNCDTGYHYGVIPEREMLHENYGLLMAVQRRFAANDHERREFLRNEMDSYLRLKEGAYPKAVYNLGLIHEELGQDKEAYECYCRAADLMPSVVKGTIESEACRRAHVAKARCMAKGKGVPQDEHGAIGVMLRLQGEIGQGNPLDALCLPAGDT